MTHEDRQTAYGDYPPACYRRTEGCTLAGGHDKSECGPVQAAAMRVEAFLASYEVSTNLDPDEVYAHNGNPLLTADLRLLLKAIQ